MRFAEFAVSELFSGDNCVTRLLILLIFRKNLPEKIFATEHIFVAHHNWFYITGVDRISAAGFHSIVASNIDDIFSNFPKYTNSPKWIARTLSRPPPKKKFSSRPRGVALTTYLLN